MGPKKKTTLKRGSPRPNEPAIQSCPRIKPQYFFPNAFYLFINASPICYVVTNIKTACSRVPAVNRPRSTDGNSRATFKRVSENSVLRYVGVYPEFLVSES
ncbi:hypothetical protein GOODEAATRI_015473 [Goodea atripinnis]|uniref:Ribosomal protein L32 n=1 Tax=Goodea atripinnis TaxID=208336 RepID=A0ABV0MI01_9TELE